VGDQALCFSILVTYGFLASFISGTYGGVGFFIIFFMIRTQETNFLFDTLMSQSLHGLSFQGLSTGGSASFLSTFFLYDRLLAFT